jgi:hypothetical protein
MVIEVELLYQPPTFIKVQEAAAAATGEILDEYRARELAWWVTYAAVVQRTAADFPNVEPRPETIYFPNYLRTLIDDQPEYTAQWVAKNMNPLIHCPAMFRGFEVRDYVRWWPVYFYRFVDPLSRLGPNLNYLDRGRRGKVWVLPVGWRIYCSPPASAKNGTIASPPASLSTTPAS